MTEKTDLTEKRDFIKPHEIILGEIIDEETIKLYDSRMMSPKEYDKILSYEKIFGRKRHFTDAIEVFKRSDYEWRMEMRGHCQRCGKYFRMPWKKKNDLCPECDSIVEVQTCGKIPWNIHRIGGRNFPTDIFRLR